MVVIGLKGDRRGDLGGKGRKVMEGVGLEINGFEMGDGKRWLLGGGILGDKVFIGLDGGVVMMIVIVEEWDLGGRVRSEGGLGIFVEELGEG